MFCNFIEPIGSYSKLDVERSMLDVLNLYKYCFHRIFDSTRFYPQDSAVLPDHVAQGPDLLHFRASAGTSSLSELDAIYGGIFKK